MRTSGTADATYSGYETGTTRGMATLSQGDFLQLLIAQLKCQDPLSPMKDQEFAAQVAQFSSLESIQNLSRQFERFAELQMWSSQVGQSANLIGKTVDLVTGEDQVTGQVDAVRIVDGAVKLVVGGREYPAAALREVRT